ncbi:MAG: polysaccharide lyase family 8 super-sandwich domain-containing protein [Dysgonomonas sp.]
MNINILKNKLIKNVLFFWAFVMVSVVPVLANNEEVQDDNATIISRITESERISTSISSLDNDITAKKVFLQSDGSFSDIDYSRQDQTNWPAANHLLRIKSYALAYVTSTSKFYQDAEIYTAIINGLEFWLSRKPTSTNWWYNQIDTGQKMGLALVLMETASNKLNPVLIKNCTDYMAANCGDPAKYSGANKTDLAVHWLYRGLVAKDDAVLNKAVSELFDPTKLTTNDDGIQHDYSYASHGYQLYIGGYGKVYVDNTVKYADILNGTGFELSSDKKVILHNFLVKTYFPSIRGKYMLYNVMGRSVTRANTGRLDASDMIDNLNILRTIDPANAEDYDNARYRITGVQSPDYMIEPIHNHYWRTDYTLHQRPDYTIDTRLVSLRINRNENGNGENLKGYFLSDGGMSIVTKGSEYVSIFPLWDWAKIPGVTAPAYPFAEIPQEPSNSKGRTYFAGGVTDGVYGASGYIYADTYKGINTSARKGWFYFDDEVVCLGAGINSTNSYAITTSVNQALLDGTIYFSNNGQESTQGKTVTTYDNVDWVLHANIGYIFPEESKVTISNETKSGNWRDINTTNSSRPVTGDIFGLWFEHGVNPDNATYAYIIVPNKKTVEELKAYNKNNIQILKNTPELQVVKHNGLNIWQLIFYEAGIFNSDDNTVSVQVDNPCVLMLENIGTPEVKAYISDPSQQSRKINVVAKLPNIGTKIAEIALQSYGSDKTTSGSTSAFIFDENSKDYEIKVPTGSIEKEVVSDSYVQSTSPDKIFGIDPAQQARLVVKSNFTRETYLKFNIEDYTSQVPEGEYIGKFEISLFVRFGNTTCGNYNLLVRKTSSEWDENTLTWNNKPAAEDDILAAQPGTTEANANILFDVTDAVNQAIAAGDKFISFNLSQELPSSGDNVYDITFHSKEYPATDMHPKLKGTLYMATTGIKTNDADEALFSIYPNPVIRGNDLNVVTNNPDQDAHFVITNVYGQTILKSSEKRINTSALPSGIYLLQTIDGNKRSALKFIVK